MILNERNFIKYLKQEKEEALEYVIDHYLPLIKGVVIKVLGPLRQEESIQECINDILFSIWKNAKSFKGDEQNFKKWVAVVSKYKAIDYYRSLIKKNEDALGDTELKLADPTINISNEIEKQYLIINMLSSLKPIDKQIFIMKYLLDLNAEEISKQLGMTKSAIENRLYYGKKSLRKKWNMEAVLNEETI